MGVSTSTSFGLAFTQTMELHWADAAFEAAIGRHSLAPKNIQKIYKKHCFYEFVFFLSERTAIFRHFLYFLAPRLDIGDLLRPRKERKQSVWEIFGRFAGDFWEMFGIFCGRRFFH